MAKRLKQTSHPRRCKDKDKHIKSFHIGSSCGGAVVNESD